MQNINNEINIFYSWQSDKNKNVLRNLVNECIKKIKKEGIYKINYTYYPNDNKTGSPDILTSIIDKIKISDVFIADLTNITDYNTTNNKTKYLQNSNVCYELGFADSILPDDNIIILTDIEPEKLFFDIRQRRITQYKIVDNKIKNMSDGNLEKNLVEYIKMAIKNVSVLRRKNTILANNHYRCQMCFSKATIDNVHDNYDIIICYNCIDKLLEISDYYGIYEQTQNENDENNNLNDLNNLDNINDLNNFDNINDLNNDGIIKNNEQTQNVNDGNNNLNNLNNLDNLNFNNDNIIKINELKNKIFGDLNEIHKNYSNKTKDLYYIDNFINIYDVLKNITSDINKIINNVSICHILQDNIYKYLNTDLNILSNKYNISYIINLIKIFSVDIDIINNNSVIFYDVCKKINDIKNTMEINIKQNSLFQLLIHLLTNKTTDKFIDHIKYKHQEKRDYIYLLKSLTLLRSFSDEENLKCFDYNLDRIKNYSDKNGIIIINKKQAIKSKLYYIGYFINKIINIINIKYYIHRILYKLTKSYNKNKNKNNNIIINYNEIYEQIIKLSECIERRIDTFETEKLYRHTSMFLCFNNYSLINYY